jgi:hypothetical protein
MQLWHARSLALCCTCAPFETAEVIMHHSPFKTTSLSSVTTPAAGYDTQAMSTFRVSVSSSGGLQPLSVRCVNMRKAHAAIAAHIADVARHM